MIDPVSIDVELSPRDFALSLNALYPETVDDGILTLKGIDTVFPFGTFTITFVRLNHERFTALALDKPVVEIVTLTLWRQYTVGKKHHYLRTTH